MKRTLLRRKTPLKQGAGPKRSRMKPYRPQETRLRQARHRRKAENLNDVLAQPYSPREVNEAYLAWLRKQRCCVTGKRGSRVDPVEACHVKTRGAFGADRQAVPMLASVHDQQHDDGIKTFARKRGIDFDRIVADHNARYTAETGKPV